MSTGEVCAAAARRTPPDRSHDGVTVRRTDVPEIQGLLFDMNGLFRHWRNAGAREGEELAGLPAGTFDRHAYQHPMYRLAKVGVITDQEWADDVERRLVETFGPDARKAIPPWRRDRGETDPVMLDLLAQARRHVPVGVLSNTTDAFATDLEHHGITGLFDFVLPSAVLGVDKPSPLAYRSAAERMGVAPGRLYYCDDEPTFVAGARHAGLRADLFTGAADFAAALNRLGITVAPPGPAPERP